MRLTTLLALAVLAGGCTDRAGRKSVDPRIADPERPLLLMTFPSVPPFSYKNEAGEIVGTDIDLARRIADRMGRKLVVESNGDLYPCDFYVKPEYRTGSVFDTSIDETLKSEGMKRFIRDSRENADMCRLCPYLPVCRGMCRRMRTLFRRSPVCPWAKLISHVTKQNPS